MPPLTFYLLAFFTLACALAVVVNRNAVNAALCLMLSLLGVAGLFVLLEAYLLAVLLVFVYVGAVVALFLFIVMLLDVKGTQPGKFGRLPVISGVIALALLLTGVASLAMRGKLPSSPEALAAGSPGSVLKNYAYELFTTYLLPVQVVGFLLLAAMLGVVVLSKKVEKPEESP